jgi:hypothetical protein
MLIIDILFFRHILPMLLLMPPRFHYATPLFDAMLIIDATLSPLMPLPDAFRHFRLPFSPLMLSLFR